MILTCAYCQQPFKTNDRRRKYCSRKCYFAHVKGQHAKTCPVCGKKFNKKDNIYCSMECYRKSRHVVSTCPTCGQTFHAPQWLHKKFCSRKCYLNRSGVDTALLIQEYRAGKSTIELSHEHGLTASAIAMRLHKAGIELRPGWLHLTTDKNPTKGKGHTEATKAKLRALAIQQFSSPEARQSASENQIKAMAEGRISCVSGLEDDVAKALDKLGVSYDRQVGIRNPNNGQFYACVDFRLADDKVLEVNGTYWHADPRVYPDGPEFASQKQTVIKYREKVARLRLFGITVIELWELDFRKAPMLSLLDALQTTPPIPAPHQLRLPIFE